MKNITLLFHLLWSFLINFRMASDNLNDRDAKKCGSFLIYCQVLFFLARRGKQQLLQINGSMDQWINCCSSKLKLDDANSSCKIVSDLPLASILDGFDQHFQAKVPFPRNQLWLTSATSIIFTLKKFWECWEWNPRQLSPEARMQTVVLCCTATIGWAVLVFFTLPELKSLIPIAI